MNPNEIVEMYNSGLSLEAIAKRIGIDRSTVRRICIGNGVVIRPKTSPRRSWDYIDEQIRKQYPSMGAESIAKQLGISKFVVYNRAQKIGIKADVAHKMQRRSDLIMSRNSSVNVDFFRTWSSNLAWLLGYIQADGSISAKTSKWYVSFGCVVDDRHILEDIKRITNAHGEITQINCPLLREKYHCRKQVRLQITSKEVVRLLMDQYKIYPNKSNIDPPMPYVPDEWLSHWARGNLDGDGSIVRPSERCCVVKFLGSHRVMDELRTRISQIVGVKTPELHKRKDHGPNSKLSLFSWSNKKDAAAVLKWMYPDGDYLCLNRKREAAMAFLESFERPRPLRLPTYTKSNEYAVANFMKKKIYLGQYGSKESQEKYRRLTDYISAGDIESAMQFAATCTQRVQRPSREKLLAMFANFGSWSKVAKHLGITTSTLLVIRNELDAPALDERYRD